MHSQTVPAFVAYSSYVLHTTLLSALSRRGEMVGLGKIEAVSNCIGHALFECGKGMPRLLVG